MALPIQSLRRLQIYKYVRVGVFCRGRCLLWCLDAKDPLFAGYEHITTGYKVTIPKVIMQAVDNGAAFIVPPRIWFRNEGDFYTLNVRWANTFNIETDLAQFLIIKKDHR